MHEVAFVVKQSHLATLEILRPMAAKYELTPARFDLLFAVYRSARFGRDPSEKSLAFTLEVSAATVCKMLKSLVELGFVELLVCEEDRRCRLVRVTPLGRHRFRKILKLVRHRRVDARLRARYAGKYPPEGGLAFWFDRIVRGLQGYLDMLRRARLYGYGGYVPAAPVLRVPPGLRDGMKLGSSRTPPRVVPIATRAAACS